MPKSEFSVSLKNPIIAKSFAEGIVMRTAKSSVLWKIILVLIAFGILFIGLYATKEQQRSNKEPEARSQESNILQVGVVRAREEVKQDAKLQTLLGKAWASWYDRSVCGKRIYGKTCKTANGEIFNDEDFTFASKDFPFGTRIEFSFNGKSKVCRLNDRGPYVEPRKFDLSKACALAIGFTGVREVNYKVLK